MVLATYGHFVVQKPTQLPILAIPYPLLPRCELCHPAFHPEIGLVDASGEPTRMRVDIAHIGDALTGILFVILGE
ncbi:hypothetical protein [Paramicrobacterium chengjingii]|uniref:hypothetical protein n=1 Tax=Paramicrobacterium chengjingii TaxID=2769067 RepID=UPI001420459E|nr:hypothetical protein [Microbacterium chengjingii]